MAAQVLSGHGSLSWTNSTGQNTRVTLNAVTSWSNCKLTITSAAGQNTTYQLTDHAMYGKYIGGGNNENRGSNHSAMTFGYQGSTIAAVPIELAMENGSNFTITDDNSLHPKYNIIIIPEAG
jgi:hypothetical protein